MKPSCEVTEKYSRLRKLPLINTWSHYRRYVEEGRRACFGMKDAVMSSLYSSMLPANSWDPAASVTHTHHGAVFNLEFSPDG